MDISTIVPILQKLESASPLDPADKANFDALYIYGLHEKQGDIVNSLAFDITSSAGAQKAFLFSGTIGSGKSTELRRLAYQLNNDDHVCIVVDALTYLNPQTEIGIVDLLMAISLATWESYLRIKSADPVEREKLRESLEPTRWKWWTTLLTSRVEFHDVEVGVGATKLKGSLRDNPAFREKLRKIFDASLDQVVRDVNRFMSDLADDIKAEKGLPHKAKAVLIVDSLEQFGGVSRLGKDDTVLKALLDIFGPLNRYLRIANWSVVYSVPPLLSKLAPGIAALLDTGKVYSLTSAHVFQDHSTVVDDVTVDTKLVPLARHRIGDAIVDQLLPPPLLKKIVVTSGGDLRDLMRMLRAVLLEAAANKAFPVTDALVDAVFSNLRRPYLPFAADTAARLAHVYANKSAPIETTDQWFELMGDLTQKRVLLYLNGQEWYDVHPLLRDAVLLQHPSGARVIPPQ